MTIRRTLVCFESDESTQEDSKEHHNYMSTSLIRSSAPLGPYRMTMPTAYGGPRGGGGSY